MTVKLTRFGRVTSYSSSDHTRLPEQRFALVIEDVKQTPLTTSFGCGSWVLKDANDSY